MAQRYYGLNRGESRHQVVIGSSSTATLDVEIRIDDASSINKQHAAELIRYALEAMLEDLATPTT